VTILARGEGRNDVLTKMKELNVYVNENTLITNFRNFEDRLGGLKQAIQELAVSGVDTSQLSTIYNRADSYMRTARSAINSDNIEELRTRLGQIQNSIKSIEDAVPVLQIYKFVLDFKWSIISIVLLLILSVYFSTQVLMPYGSITKKVIFLRDKESELKEIRVNTEKQYFHRQIDEKTFNSILTKNQAEILKTKTMITENERELDFFFRKRLSPKAFGRWTLGGILRFRRRKKPEKVEEEKKGA
jgi:hypothetical protein